MMIKTLGLVLTEQRLALNFGSKVFLEKQLVVDQSTQNNESETDTLDQVGPNIEGFQFVLICCGKDGDDDSYCPNGCCFCHIQQRSCEGIKHFCDADSSEIEHGYANYACNHQEH